MVATKARLKETERRLDDIENQARRSSIIISGVPETDGERTDSLVVDLGKAARLQLTTDNFDRCHRLGRAEPGKTRPIMAKFLSANARQKLSDNRKDLTVGKVRGCHMGYHMVWL